MLPDVSSMTQTVTANKVPWWRCALIAMLPAAIVLAAIALLFGAGPRRFVPLWSDEVVYWNEAAVFGEAGFQGGYITIQEETAAWQPSRFGPHGPAFAVFHGAIARAFGWRPYSAFLVNLALVTVAALAWVRGVRGGTSAAAVVVVATFWPLLLYLPTNMQEPAHFAFAFLFALSLDRIDRSRGAAWAWTIPLLIAAALVRPSWMLMLLPLGWRAARRRGITGIGVVLAVTAAACAAAWMTFDRMASPSPQNTRVLTSAWMESAPAAIAAVRATVAENLTQYVALREESPQIVLRYFLAVFIATLSVRWWSSRKQTDRRAEALEVALVTLVPVLVLVILAGQVESWRDFRVLTPHLLVALLVLATRGGRERWLWAATLVLLPVYYAGFVAFHGERFSFDAQRLEAMHDATAATMPFVPGADPWTNTLLVHADLLQAPLVAIPRGIGVSYVFDWDNLAPPVRSRYLLLRIEDLMRLRTKVRLTPIATTPLGTIYRNEGSGTASASALTSPEGLEASLGPR
jgi:hypothetical protein